MTIGAIQENYKNSLSLWIKIEIIFRLGIYVNYKQPKEDQLYIAFKNAICDGENSIFYILKQRQHVLADLIKCILYYIVKMPIYIKKRIYK